MAEDFKLYQDRDMGAKAQRLVDDPAFIEVVKRFEARLFEAWRDENNSGDVDTREEWWRMGKVLKKFQDELQTMVDDGKVADRQIREDEEKAKNG